MIDTDNPFSVLATLLLTILLLVGGVLCPNQMQDLFLVGWFQTQTATAENTNKSDIKPQDDIMLPDHVNLPNDLVFSKVTAEGFYMIMDMQGDSNHCKLSSKDMSEKSHLLFEDVQGIRKWLHDQSNKPKSNMVYQIRKALLDSEHQDQIVVAILQSDTEELREFFQNRPRLLSVFLQDDTYRDDPIDHDLTTDPQVGNQPVQPQNQDETVLPLLQNGTDCIDHDPTTDPQVGNQPVQPQNQDETVLPLLQNGSDCIDHDPTTDPQVGNQPVQPQVQLNMLWQILVALVDVWASAFGYVPSS